MILFVIFKLFLVSLYQNPSAIPPSFTDPKMLKTHIATQIYAKICFNTTSGQKKIIESLSEYLSESDPAAIFVLNGYAGTGKTTLIAALVGALKDCGIKPVLLAPTGRAAKMPGTTVANLRLPGKSDFWRFSAGKK